MLTIYVWPLVFLNRASLSPVVTGLVFLSRNLVASAWIVGVTFAAQLLQVGGLLAVRAQYSPWNIALAIGCAVLATFFMFVSFTAAARVLLENTAQASGSDAR